VPQGKAKIWTKYNKCQQYETKISQFPHKQRDIDTNYENYNEKQYIFGFKPPKEKKKVNLLQKFNGRILFASEKLVIYFLPNYLSACKP